MSFFILFIILYNFPVDLSNVCSYNKGNNSRREKIPPMEENSKAIFEMDYSKEPRRSILCVDIKSFFASVEAVDRGENPFESMIVVVSKPDNKGGLVLASTPKVKEKYNIQTGTRVYEIPKDAAIDIVEPRMALYLKVNLEILKIYNRYVAAEDLHVYSVDESFLDVTHSHSIFGSIIEIAMKIQKDILNELGLIATVGMGDNPLLAKLALDHQAKHDFDHWYQAYWRYEDVPETIWRIENLTDFWGIGSRTEEKLKRIGIHGIYDLAHADLSKIRQRFGVIGEQLFFHSHGIDRTILSDQFSPKTRSFSKNQVLNHDYNNPDDVKIVIRELTEENGLRLRKHQLVTRQVKLVVQYSKYIDHPGFNHQMKIDATDSTKKLISYLLYLFERHYEPYPVRVINVSFKQIEAGQERQLTLFEDPEDVSKEERLNQTIDIVREKYGYTSLLYASSLFKNSMALQRSKLLGGHQADYK